MTTTLRKEKMMDIDSTKTKIVELRTRMGQLRDEIQRVQTQHVPPEVVAQRIAQSVSEAAIRWRGSESLLQGAASPTLSGSIDLPWRAQEPIPWGALCAGDSAHASAILTTLLEAEMSSSEYKPGLPLAERPRRVSDLEAELQEVGATEEALIDDAIACGLDVEHRNETFYRRARAEQENSRQKALDAAYRVRLRAGGTR